MTKTTSPPRRLRQRDTAPLRARLKSTAWDDVLSAVQEVTSGDDEPLVGELSEGLIVDGEVTAPPGSEVHRRVRARFRGSVAPLIARRAGLLDEAHRLQVVNCGTLVDFGFLAGLTKLEIVVARKLSPRADLATLSGLPNLDVVWLDGVTVEQIAGLAALPKLSWLRLSMTVGLTDLSALRPLQGLRRVELLSQFELSDISALRDLPKLDTLMLSFADKLPAEQGGLLWELPELRELTLGHRLGDFGDAVKYGDFSHLDEVTIE